LRSEVEAGMDMAALKAVRGKEQPERERLAAVPEGVRE
jgi:hypothetical protein